MDQRFLVLSLYNVFSNKVLKKERIAQYEMQMRIFMTIVDTAANHCLFLKKGLETKRPSAVLTHTPAGFAGIFLGGGVKKQQ